MFGQFIYDEPLTFGCDKEEVEYWPDFKTNASILNITVNGFVKDLTREDVERCGKVASIMLDERNGI